MKIAKNITQLIGKTPLVELEKINRRLGTNFVAKLEFFNPLSSIKDRIALSMIEAAEQQGLLLPGGTVVEPTSGNTGIGLAYICAYKGYRLILTMPDSMSIERQNLLRAFGAQIVLTPGAASMGGAISAAEDILAKTPNSFMPQQFNNPANPSAHERTTAQEIWEDTDGTVQAIISGVGTGGTATGISRGLKKYNPAIKIFAFEPASSSVMSGGRPGPHKIQGVGAGFIPPNNDVSAIDKVVRISDEDAYHYTNMLAKEEGIFAGISSGAALAGAVHLHAKGELTDQLTVLIFPDSGERYLSTKNLFC